MLIAETFESIQGEGPYAGTASLFVRTSGCNLRCSFCDTPYTSWQPEGTEFTWEEIAAVVAAGSTPHVVITGGEPLLAADLAPLTDACSEMGRVVTIETAGTIFRDDLKCDLMSVSPKMSNSTPDDDAWRSRHDKTRLNPDVIRRLTDMYECHFKFVIDEPADADEVVEYLQAMPTIDDDRVWLMPQCRTTDELKQREAWVAALAARHGFRYSPRLQIEQFGNTRGT